MSAPTVHPVILLADPTVGVHLDGEDGLLIVARPGSWVNTDFWREAKTEVRNILLADPGHESAERARNILAQNALDDIEWAYRGRDATCPCLGDSVDRAWVEARRDVRAAMRFPGVLREWRDATIMAAHGRGAA